MGRIKAMTVLLVAFYFGCMVGGQEWPLIIGPYEDWDDCASVREFLDRRGYETDTCALLPYPQEGSLYLEVGYLPYLTPVQNYMPSQPQQSLPYYGIPPVANEPFLLIDPNRPDAAVLLLPGFPHLLAPLREGGYYPSPYRMLPQEWGSPLWQQPESRSGDLQEGLGGLENLSQ